MSATSNNFLLRSGFFRRSDRTAGDPAWNESRGSVEIVCDWTRKNLHGRYRESSALSPPTGRRLTTKRSSTPGGPMTRATVRANGKAFGATGMKVAAVASAFAAVVAAAAALLTVSAGPAE